MLNSSLDTQGLVSLSGHSRVRGWYYEIEQGGKPSSSLMRIIVPSNSSFRFLYIFRRHQVVALRTYFRYNNSDSYDEGEDDDDNDYTMMMIFTKTFVTLMIDCAFFLTFLWVCFSWITEVTA